MWPMGHIAIAYLLYTGWTRLRYEEIPAAGPAIVVVFASLFPDIVDKPLAWYLGVLPTGRTLAHSLLFLLPLCLGIYLFTRARDKGEYGIAFAIGALSHSLVDALPVLWRDDASASFLLWPYWAVEPYEGAAPTPLELLQASLSQPYFLAEFVLLGLALILWHRHGYPGLSFVRRPLGNGSAETDTDVDR